MDDIYETMKKSCAIIISHFKSLPFLKACVRQTRKFRHPEIEQHIFIAEQSDDETYLEVFDEFGLCEDITIVRMKSLYSGYGVDYLIQKGYINTEYIVQLHSDAFAIHKNWIYLPIKLMEENNLAFCGQLQFISDGTPHIYPPSPMFAMAQCYNLGRTDVYKEMSFKAGFTRFHNRLYAEPGISWEDTSWTDWAAADYNARGSDDDVVAFHWQDKYRADNKLGLAISGYIEPSFGRLIDDMVFHFGSANEARTVMGSMPKLYREYSQHINQDYNDELIEEMIALAKANRPPNLEILSRNHWDGTKKLASPTTEVLNKRIEELKNM